MSSGGQSIPRPYSAIIPVELLLAVAAPVGAVLLSDVYWVPLAIFVMTSVPAGVALYLHGFLPVPRSSILIGGVCYIAGGLLSTLMATGASSAGLVGLLWPSLLVLYFMLLLSLVPLLQEHDAKLILLTMVLACGVNAGINATLFFIGDPRAALPLDGRFVAVIGTPQGRWPTVVSAIYAVLFAAAFALSVSAAQSRWIRVLAGAAVLSIGTALVLTLARSGYLAALAAMLSVVPFVKRRERLIILCAIGVIVLVVLYPPIFDEIFKRGMSFRTDIWLDYLLWAWQSPWVGQGLLANVHRMIGGLEFYHAHNLLISALVRGGLLSLAGMALMLGGGLYWSWTYARRSGDPIILAMMVAISVAGMFDYELLLMATEWSWVGFWLPIGLAAGAELAVRRDRAATGATTS